MNCLLPDKLTMKKVKIVKRRIIVAVKQHELAQVTENTLENRTFTYLKLPFNSLVCCKTCTSTSPLSLFPFPSLPTYK